LRGKLDLELASGENGGAVSSSEDDVLVAEYVSDDETASTAADKMEKDEGEDDIVHVTKVFLCDIS
jgi:hypothetical protein